METLRSNRLRWFAYLIAMLVADDIPNRCVVIVTLRLPGDVDWTLPWHEILHHWNERVKFFTSRHGLKSWSAVCLGQYWKFAHYISNLPRERRVVRAMNWFPANARRVGRPAYTWDSMIQHFCRHKQIGNWRERAQNFSFWMSQFDDFLSFTDT